MKRLYLILILLALGYSLMALEITAFRTEELSRFLGGSSPYETASQLSSRGVEIYYYNELSMICGLNPQLNQDYSELNSTRIPSPSRSERLYLVTKLPDRELPTGLDIVLDLGSSVLIRSNLDEVALTRQIVHPFVVFDLVPIKFNRSEAVPSATLQETRTSILQMTQAVSADSVLAFIQALQNFQTRYALADNRLAVATWIKNQFLRFGISNAELFPFTWNNTDQYNVVATIPGTVNPDEYIIVGGHHDSITGTTPYQFAPGADDNASGSVAALEMARVMMATGFQPKCSIRFMTFAAEEFGLWGAKAYANHAEANDLQIRLMVNHDMIANSNENPATWRVRLMPYEGSMPQSDYAVQQTEEFTTLNAVFGSANSASSDSYPFWQKGYPVIYFFEYEFCPYYHSDLDITANLNPTYCAEVIRASIASTAGYSMMPATPQNVEVVDAGNGNQLIISWNPSTDTDISYYNVYYFTQGNPAIGPFPVTDNSYTVSGLTEGVEYTLQVASVDAVGTESYRISRTGTPQVIPAMPTEFNETPILGGIGLDWAPNTEADFAGYMLYRSLVPGQIGSPAHTGMLTEPTYTDTNVNSQDGYYYYTVIALDLSGNPSPYSATVSSRPITLDRGVLIIDETKNFTTENLFQIPDQAADDFYLACLGDLPSQQLDLESFEPLLRLADIGVYSSILWHGNDASEMDYVNIVKDQLKAYVAAGGDILFSVIAPSLVTPNAGNDPFSSACMGFTGVDYSTAARFKYANSAAPGIPSLSVDPLKAPASMNGHIFRVEGMIPAAGANTLLTFGSDYGDQQTQGQLNGLPVGLHKQYGEGEVVTLSFPLYYMMQDQATALVQHVFTNIFGESTDNNDPGLSPTPMLSLSTAYPNPFGQTTSFSISSKDSSSPVNIGIYNLRGQLVKTILNDLLTTKTSLLSWDGHDDMGRACATGIYFIRAKQGTDQSSRKLVLMK